MKYIEINTNKEIWIHKIRSLYPNMSISDNADLTEIGYKLVTLTEPPVMEGFYAVEVTPVDFVQTWELRPVEIAVPIAITPLQAKLQLLEMGLLDDVELMVKENRKYGIYWENVQSIERNSAILLEISTLLNLTEARVDEMFIAASKIAV